MDASSVSPFNSLCALGPDSLFSLLQGQAPVLYETRREALHDLANERTPCLDHARCD